MLPAGGSGTRRHSEGGPHHRYLSARSIQFGIAVAPSLPQPATAHARAERWRRGIVGPVKAMPRQHPGSAYALRHMTLAISTAPMATAMPSLFAAKAS